MMQSKDAEIERIKAQIAELTEANEKAPGWGAAVGARHERLRNLEASLNRSLAPCKEDEAPHD
jgi:hypothetical protein